MKSIKRIIAFALILCMVLSLCACKSSEARAVEQQIKNLGEITLDSEQAIKEAKDAYNALSSEDQASVKNYDVLEQAESRYMVISLEKEIDEIGEVTLESETAISELVDAYEKMTEDEQTSVSNYEKLEGAVEELTALQIADWCNDAYYKLSSSAEFYMDTYTIPMLIILALNGTGDLSDEETAIQIDSLRMPWTIRGAEVGSTRVSDTQELIDKVLEKDPDNECAKLLGEMREKVLTYQELAESLYDYYVPDDWKVVYEDYSDNYPDLDARVSEAMPTA